MVLFQQSIGPDNDRLRTWMAGRPGPPLHVQLLILSLSFARKRGVIYWQKLGVVANRSLLLQQYNSDPNPRVYQPRDNMGIGEYKWRNYLFIVVKTKMDDHKAV